MKKVKNIKDKGTKCTRDKIQISQQSLTIRIHRCALDPKPKSLSILVQTFGTDIIEKLHKKIHLIKK